MLIGPNRFGFTMYGLFMIEPQNGHDLVQQMIRYVWVLPRQMGGHEVHVADDSMSVLGIPP